MRRRERKLSAQIIDLNAERAMREAREAAKGRHDRINDVYPPGRYDELKADRDSAARAADDKIVAGAVERAAPMAQETRPRPEVEASREAWAAAEPAQASPQVSEAEHELAATADAAVDRAEHASEGLLRGFGRLIGDLIGWLGDFMVSPAAPTREQVEGMARAAEEKQEQKETHADQEAQHWLIIEAQRRTREREEAEIEQGQAHRREQDRGYERER